MVELFVAVAVVMVIEIAAEQVVGDDGDACGDAGDACEDASGNASGNACDVKVYSVSLFVATLFSK